MGRKKFNKKHLFWIIPLSVIIIGTILFFSLREKEEKEINKCKTLENFGRFEFEHFDPLFELYSIKTSMGEEIIIDTEENKITVKKDGKIINEREYHYSEYGIPIIDCSERITSNLSITFDEITWKLRNDCQDRTVEICRLE